MRIPIILGPTCSGKTSLALEIAKQMNWDILSIDSRQVFKDLDIGTGKIKEDVEISKHDGYWEVGGIKIWGYDVYNLDFDLNVLKYCEFCRDVILRYKKEEKGLIITCGTGFYLDFLLGNIAFTEIDIGKKNLLEKEDLGKLNEILQKLVSSDEISKVDTKNKRRVITKILSVGSPKVETRFSVEGVNFETYLLKLERKTLYENADNFIDFIIKKGVVAEYEKLHKTYPDAKAWGGLIYSEIRNNELDLIQKMKFSMHSYIRRQETYMKKMKINSICSSSIELKNKITSNFKLKNSDTIN